MTLRQASRLLLVIITAWSLCGIAVLVDDDPASHPSQILFSQAYAGDPDEFSDGTDERDTGDPTTSSDRDDDEGLIASILDWFEDVVKDLF